MTSMKLDSSVEEATKKLEAATQKISLKLEGLYYIAYVSM